MFINNAILFVLLPSPPLPNAPPPPVCRILAVRTGEADSIANTKTTSTVKDNLTAFRLNR